MPKLDATRLCGERGIPILPKTFQGVKFKGKGHEAKDLGVIMKYLEHWAHRLFPKMPFDEVLERIERLGTKKEVQSCIKKMRLDMPILSSDFVQEADEEDEDGMTSGTNQNSGTQPGLDRDAEDVWDEMIREEEEAMKNRPTPVKTSHLMTALSQSDTPSSHNTDNSHTPSTPHTPSSNGSCSLAMGLTPEQVERMERNKRLAMEKRNKGNAVFKIPATPTSVNGSPIRKTKTTPATISNSDLTQENGISSTSAGSDVMSKIITQQDHVNSHKNSNVTPATDGSVGNDTDMSNVFSVIDNFKVNQSEVNSSTYNSSHEMSEVIPLVSNIGGDNYSGDCSPSKMRKTDDI
ncbi:TIMELESS-interacting protein-like isoform X2 [Ylistrum balloti]|nr:TIMELESS-interacting protein-like isoform X2 [Ylistrum balloti]